jgi:hypothetical protein
MNHRIYDRLVMTLLVILTCEVIYFAWLATA